MPAIDWEGVVGVKLFSWVAGVALVLAAVFFLRYSIEHGWLSPAVRMAIGLLVGVGLLVGCELRAARRYPVTANALDAAGIATLFATLFAAHARWHLVGQGWAFLAMTLVTGVAVLLAIRRDSPFIALLGLVGGFATPALLSTGEDRPLGLFSYLLLLNVGLAWVAYRKGWVLLTGLSVVLTALYQWGWVIEFLDASRLPLALAIFLLFPVVQVAALVLGQRQPDTAARDPLFARTAITAAALPLLFALYLAAVPAYGARTNLLFGFVLLMSAGLTTIAGALGPALLHPLGALAAVLAFAIWTAVSYTSTAWPGILAWVAGFVLFYLSAPGVAARRGGSLGEPGRETMLAAPVLLFMFPLLAAIEPAAAGPGLLFGTLLVLLLVIAGVAIRSEDGRLHLVAAAFALAAEAVWSAKHLTPDRLLAALLVYGGLGLFYVGVPLVAARLRKRLQPEEGTAFVLLASLALLFFLAAGPLAHAALWGLGLLLLVLLAGIFAVVPTVGWPLFSTVAVALAWLVMAVWWATAMVAALLLPALAVVGGLALLVLAGMTWTSDRAAADRAPQGLGLALVAYGFFALVAVRPDLSLPPWPLFGAVAVLILATGTAALAIRDGRPHLVGIVLSQLLVALWLGVARTAPWPMVALGAADAVVLLALGWILLARRRHADDVPFAQAALAAVLLAQGIAMLAAEATGAPSLAWLGTEHVLLLAGLLAVATDKGWWGLVPVGAVTAGLATTRWVFAHPGSDAWLAGLLFAAAPYLVLVGYAFDVGHRLEAGRAPHVAAALAGVVFLYLARRCLLAGGWEDVVGAIPIAQAALMLLLLRRVLQARPVPVGGDGRVALVAALALGFATAAIPLQLSREWITVTWALETPALAWLYRRIRFAQLRWWIAGLAAAVFVRLALNPAVLAYHPRAGIPIWNWYLYTYAVSAGALLAAARLLAPTDDRPLPTGPRLGTLLPAAATVLLFLLLNIEIADFYSSGSTMTFDLSAGLAQDLTYTLGWALFAIGLLVAGIRATSRPVRVAALALLVVTVVKCFLHDLWRLGGLYRVGSFVGLAVCLSLVAILLQRFVFLPKEETA
jgi:uncharacterized membrane protein